MTQTIFTLASARSGTLYLRNLFRNNVPGCRARHEPFFDWGNPTMLGPAIYDAYAGRYERLRERLNRKRAYIGRLNSSVYLESNHAFLKSTYRVALEFFPQLQLVHLIRDPLKVAKSEAYREAWRRRLRVPFHYYQGEDGRMHFYWALTGNEEIFEAFARSRLSLFQRYLIQWIEIENRAQRFLREHDLTPRCFTLHVPRDLNDSDRLRAMFQFFGLRTARLEIRRHGRKNTSFGQPTAISSRDEFEAAQVLRQIPSSYLEIFEHEPYANQAWRRRLASLLDGPPPARPGRAGQWVAATAESGHAPGTNESCCSSAAPAASAGLVGLLQLFVRVVLGAMLLPLLWILFAGVTALAICTESGMTRLKWIRQRRWVTWKPVRATCGRPAPGVEQA